MSAAVSGGGWWLDFVKKAQELMKFLFLPYEKNKVFKLFFCCY